MTEPTSLSDVRARIDSLDGELVRLLADRQRLVRTAAAFKTDEQAVRAPGPGGAGGGQSGNASA